MTEAEAVEAEAVKDVVCQNWVVQKQYGECAQLKTDLSEHVGAKVAGFPERGAATDDFNTFLN